MKAFDGKKAAQEYMSAHTLAFSTPEMTLTRFAMWLGDAVPDPADPAKTVPRIDVFASDQEGGPSRIVDDGYRPSGAVLHTGMYGNSRFCHECGAGVSKEAKFCPGCGQSQS